MQTMGNIRKQEVKSITNTDDLLAIKGLTEKGYAQINAGTKNMLMTLKDEFGTLALRAFGSRGISIYPIDSHLFMACIWQGLEYDAASGKLVKSYEDLPVDLYPNQIDRMNRRLRGFVNFDPVGIELETHDVKVVRTRVFRENEIPTITRKSTPVVERRAKRNADLWSKKSYIKPKGR